MKTLAVIPARYKSSRFPGKPLAPILGVPMVIRVARITAEAFGVDSTVVATDDERIAAVVRAAGFQVAMTSDSCATGTDRLAEVASQMPADVYINVQGDEPMLDPAELVRVRDAKANYPGMVVNGMCPLGPNEDPHDVNVPKVVAAENGRLLYMSRAAVPGSKVEIERVFHKQICIYAFEGEHLEKYAAFGRKSVTESYEDIEILRFLDLGIGVQMVPVAAGTLAVDNPEDVERVEALMRVKGMS